MIGRIGGVLRSYAEVARSPSYFPLWLSQLVSNFGDTLHYIALGRVRKRTNVLRFVAWNAPN